MKKKPKGGAQEAWRQPYIDSFNVAAGHPAGLPFLHHNMKAMEEAAKARRERPAPPQDCGRPHPQPHCVCLECAKARGNKPAIKVRTEGSSRPGGSVARARAIFAELKGKTRAEMMEACEKAGINKGTAATQYGRWKKEQA